MLARPYLTPSELGIDHEIFEGLLRVRDMLRTGELEYRPPRSTKTTGRGFNMTFWECGTVRCIGGWLHEMGALKIHPRFMCYPRSMEPLFLACTGGWEGEPRSITAEQAADAIDRWLCGDPTPHAPR